MLTVQQVISYVFGAINGAGLQPIIIAAAIISLAILAVKALAALKD